MTCWQMDEQTNKLMDVDDLEKLERLWDGKGTLLGG